MKTFDEVMKVYNGVDAQASRDIYAELAAVGPAGVVAMNLMRACKKSEAAKRYRGSRFKSAAYDGKQWAMDQLCAALATLPGSWGWSVDAAALAGGSPHHHVLYVEIPTGQVSFHNGYRGAGPDYPGLWDGVRGYGPARICAWAASLLGDADAVDKVSEKSGLVARRSAQPAGETLGPSSPAVSSTSLGLGQDVEACQSDLFTDGQIGSLPTATPSPQTSQAQQSPPHSRSGP